MRLSAGANFIRHRAYYEANGWNEPWKYEEGSTAEDNGNSEDDEYPPPVIGPHLAGRPREFARSSH